MKQFNPFYFLIFLIPLLGCPPHEEVPEKTIEPNLTVEELYENFYLYRDIYGTDKSIGFGMDKEAIEKLYEISQRNDSLEGFRIVPGVRGNRPVIMYVGFLDENRIANNALFIQETSEAIKFRGPCPPWCATPEPIPPGTYKERQLESERNGEDEEDEEGRE